jgi:RNase H-fold protein (predicted Holliday junction resolvase)
MATTMIGSIGPYDPEMEAWDCYFERFEQFVAANKIEDNARVATLLANLGSTAYGTLRILVSPTKPGTVSLENIDKALNSHYGPQTIVIAERFKFYKAHQEEGESVQQFAARLRKLARHCAYGESLTTMLRDMLVCGLSNTACQKRLLTEKELTFDTAFQKAVSDEVAVRDVEQLSQNRGTDHNAKSNEPVHRVEESRRQMTNKQTKAASRPKFSSSKACAHCGKRNHASEACRFRSAKCH